MISTFFSPRSVWTGQDFVDDYAYVIDGPVLMRNATDFNQLKNEYTEADVVKQFDDIFLPRSNLTVLEIINLVWIFRSLIKKKTRPRPEETF